MILLDLMAVIPPDEKINVHVPNVGNIEDKCVDIYFNPHFLEIGHSVIVKLKHNVDCLEIWIDATMGSVRELEISVDARCHEQIPPQVED